MDNLLERFRVPLIFVLSGLLLVGVSVLYANKGRLGSSKVEIADVATDSGEVREIIIEVSGAVEKPGVYRLSLGSRVEDALILAGGLSENADRTWVEKTLNRAAKLIDGQKIYIPIIGIGNKQTNTSTAINTEVDQTTSPKVLSEKGTLVNINTASLKELDALPGIGPVYAQTITEQRPYSNTEELLTKGVLKAYVYEKIKNLITVY